MTHHQTIELDHRDLEGLGEFITGFFGEVASSREIAIAEAAWYKCMERRAAPASEPAVDRDSVLEEVALHFDQKSRMCNPAYVAEFVRDLKLATPAAPEVPHGYKVVPLKPTAKMLIAGAESEDKDFGLVIHDCYRTMLAAAPEVPESNPANNSSSSNNSMNSPVWCRLNENAFVGYEEYSMYRSEIEGLTRRANRAAPEVPAPAASDGPIFNIVPNLTKQDESDATKGICPTCKYLELKEITTTADGFRFMGCGKCKDITVLRATTSKSIEGGE